MIVSDGNFNSAIESIVKHNLQLDSGFNLLNVRVKDLSLIGDQHLKELFTKTTVY